MLHLLVLDLKVLHLVVENHLLVVLFRLRPDLFIPGIVLQDQELCIFLFFLRLCLYEISLYLCLLSFFLSKSRLLGNIEGFLLDQLLILLFQRSALFRFGFDLSLLGKNRIALGHYCKLSLSLGLVESDFPGQGLNRLGQLFRPLLRICEGAEFK